MVGQFTLNLTSQACSQSRLAVREPFQRLTVARELVGQKLQRDEPAKLDVFGLIHHAHSAAADFFQNADSGRSFRQSLRLSGPPDSLSPSRCMWRIVVRRWRWLEARTCPAR